MTCPEPLLRFISAQQSGHQAGAQFIVAWYSGGYSVYVLTTNQGQVHVKQHFFSLKNGVPEQTEFYEYDAEYFAYSGEGYLLAEGRWHLEEQYLLTLSDGVEHLAVRVAPLSEENRQMCAKYIANVGYGVNNLFITNWTETDFADVDFYDLFQLFYEECYGRKCPYGMSEDLSVGAEYRIAAQEFETASFTFHNNISTSYFSKRLEEVIESFVTDSIRKITNVNFHSKILLRILSHLLTRSRRICFLGLVRNCVRFNLAQLHL